MTDLTPETAPRMHAAANESIEAMFKQGCALEAERDALKQAITDFAAAFSKIKWGWDGDCGSDKLVDALEDHIR